MPELSGEMIGYSLILNPNGTPLVRSHSRANLCPPRGCPVRSSLTCLQKQQLGSQHLKSCLPIEVLGTLRFTANGNFAGLVSELHCAISNIAVLSACP